MNYFITKYTIYINCYLLFLRLLTVLNYNNLELYPRIVDQLSLS